MSICSTDLGDLGGALVASPNTAMHALDCSRATLYRLLNTGEIESFNEGKSRKIVVASIHEYIKRKLEQASTGKAA